MMPAQKHYTKLLTVLRGTTQALDVAVRALDGAEAPENKKARLDLGLIALRQVILYLQCDEEVLDNFLTRPLAMLENALHDAGQGATVALLEHASARLDKKPSGLARESVQGGLAFALELLLASKMNKEQAAKWVAAEARRSGLRSENGNVIVGRQIENWRSEIKGLRAPKGAREFFDGLRTLRPQHIVLLKSARSVEKRDECEGWARAVINGMASGTPLSAPKPNHSAGQ